MTVTVPPSRSPAMRRRLEQWRNDHPLPAELANRYMTDEAYVAWLTALPPELQPIAAGHLREAAEEGHDCFVRNHHGRIRDLTAQVERLSELAAAHQAASDARLRSTARRLRRAGARPSQPTVDSALGRHDARRHTGVTRAVRR